MPAGHAEDDEYLRLRPTQAYGGHPVSYESHLLPAERIAEPLGRAGLVITTRLVQEPDEGARGQSPPSWPGNPNAPTAIVVVTFPSPAVSSCPTGRQANGH
ncbi:hypothetical protein STRTUCAR8_04678 [Streptomyces turgidiscabies Car8]|uniref:Uncharacterized protein n=1 Tax=Streptomyces turgidiscabies (strain Car8) TaxID=698760 RepID=L7EYU5_STRT8|nr:hypothetical protein STRTUCAR8_04678 [Streptomyces turgidiscabies Car8]